MIQWLLRNNPDLLGDLLEERASGRSRAWYGRQVLIAVARSIFDEGRRHPVLTLRAVVTALAVYFATSIIAAGAYGFLSFYLFRMRGNAYPSSPWWLILLIVAPSAAAGWIVARTHRACMEAAIVAIILIWAPIAMPINEWTPTAQFVGLLAGAFIGMRKYARAT
jgi:hypothetical protein